MLQRPAWQRSLLLPWHERPQRPQWSRFVERSTHCSPHTTRPPSQTSGGEGASGPSLPLSAPASRTPPPPAEPPSPALASELSLRPACPASPPAELASCPRLASTGRSPTWYFPSTPAS